jgi:hypothetical protein
MAVNTILYLRRGDHFLLAGAARRMLRNLLAVSGKEHATIA